MPSQAYETIKRAIRDRRQVIAEYGGYTREMCPHAIGTKGGREQALFYQFGGGSSSGPVVPGSTQNWRCMEVAGIANIRVRDGAWHTAPNHTRPQTCIDSVDLDVMM